MKCPKCSYISFGSADRCRNCGYEFLLASEGPAPLDDLRIDDREQLRGPLADYVLTEQPPLPPSPFAGASASGSAASRRPSTGSRFDLPLFGDDAPLVTPPAIPRAPLSVRRGQPALARPRADRAVVTGEQEDEQLSVLERPGPRIIRLEDGKPVELPKPAAPAEVRADEPVRPASSLARVVAGLVDILVLAIIDAGVLYSTLRLVDLPVERISAIPVVPMGLFLVLLNGGYLAIFTTAGGQTIGKMLARIRVVADPSPEAIDADGPLQQVPLGASVLRATAYLASLLPAGLGFAAILFDSDGRALHDRLAETRVVKA